MKNKYQAYRIKNYGKKLISVKDLINRISNECQYLPDNIDSSMILDIVKYCTNQCTDFNCGPEIKTYRFHGKVYGYDDNKHHNKYFDTLNTRVEAESRNKAIQLLYEKFVSFGVEYPSFSTSNKTLYIKI